MNRFIINSISSLRILFGFLFIYFAVFDFDIACLVIIFALTCVSDVSDGWLSRKYGLSSDNGAKFDVTCDFIFIMLSTFAMVWMNLIPPWFMLIIVLKLIEFFTTSGEWLVYENFGHLVALMFYAFPIFAVFINNRFIILILAVFITVCAIISSLTRIHQKFY